MMDIKFINEEKNKGYLKKIFLILICIINYELILLYFEFFVNIFY